MDKDCKKYEGLYLFGKDEDFFKHINECAECQKEYEKEQRLSELLKDSATTYRLMEKKSNVKKTMYKIACSLVVFSCLGVYTGFEINENHKYQQFIKTNTETSIISQYGLPVDEYGFFAYN